MLGQIPTPKSLCILRLSAIGDVCHAVAMVQQIQKQYPDIEITWVLGKVEHMLLKDLPGINFVIFDKSKGFTAFKELKSAMNGRKFDVLFHMQAALRASIASLCISAKIRIGFDRARAREGQWLFSNRKVAPQNQPHVLEGFMAFANAIGVKTEEPHWLMPFGENERTYAKELIPQDKFYTVISAAASKAERNWPAQKYAQAADYLSKKGYHVVLCGGPGELEVNLANDIAKHANVELINLVGKTNLKQLMAVLESAKLVIAPDTGPTHMATTVETPVIGLYAHSNPKRTGPYTCQHYVASVYEECVLEQHGKPSEQLPWNTRAKGELMDRITVDMVITNIDKILS
ncbi:glycosyltransferase family 9 protein [Thalassotalea nanhaiensis]|uniref:Glycosyltransferase family 9 protein n=1 Tax=Thalassotalea nanhaiensis TaxID=3065648 RepID=A0ABY9TMF2_9GAMM|nr:glycosyltransferase family 9 protein [Colwelliaceae bacterium SQ345]